MQTLRKTSLLVLCLCLLLGGLPAVAGAVEQRRLVEGETLTIKAAQLEYDLKTQVAVFTAGAHTQVEVNYGKWDLAGTTLHYEEASAYLRLTGNVWVRKQGAEPLTLKGEELEAWLPTEKLVVRGQVQLSTSTYQAQAEIATFEGDKVVLTGKPILFNKEATLTGAVITVYFTPTARIIVEDATLEVKQ